MKAKVWVFEHPYARVTKEDGKFEITNLPDIDLTVEFWHDKLSTGDSPYLTVPVPKGGKDLGDLKVEAK